MSSDNDYNYNLEYKTETEVKEGLNYFVKDSIRFLRDRVNNPLPDDHPLSTDKELFGEDIDTLLQEAFKELELDPDNPNNSKNYIKIRNEIFNENITFDQFKNMLSRKRMQN